MGKYDTILKHYPDFPIPGIDFIDIMPLLQNREAFKSIVNDIADALTCPNVATVEARGFLFAAPLLTETENVANVIAIRKKGKLPFSGDDLHDVAITKEYGKDHVYYRLSDIAAGVPDGDIMYVSILDDILATGGTAKGIAEALNKETVTVDGKTYQVKVKEFVFIVELASEIPGASEMLSEIAPVKSIIKV